MAVERIVANTFLETHPEDAVRILEQIPEKETASLLESLASPLSARIMQYMDVLTATRCLVGMNPEVAGEILERFSMEVSVMYLRRIGETPRTAIMERMPEDLNARLRRVLAFPEGTAGALMNPDVFTLQHSITAGEAVREIRDHAEQLSLYIYVLDREKRLVGAMNLRELFLASPEISVASIMQTNVKKLSAYADLPAVLVHPGWLSYSALPVVEEGDFFAGDLRFKTLLKLERDQNRRRISGQLGPTGEALGELYKIGLSGLFRSIVSQSNPEAIQ